MKHRLLRLVLTDYGKLTAVAIAIILLAAIGAGLNGVVSRRMLRSDAESTAEAWAGTLVNAATDLPEVLEGNRPSEPTSNLLNESVKVGDVYRFRLWDNHGHQVLRADRLSGPQQAKDIIERCGQEGARAVLSGSNCTVLDTGRMPENPRHFACAFVPIIHNDTVIGIAEVYVDLSSHAALYARSFFLCESIAAIAVLLAGGFPVYMVYRKMVEHRVARTEAQFLADHDALTGVANRKRITETGKAALALSRRNHSPVAALMLDLDHFKEVNDSYGHAMGDELLRKVSERILSTIREEDTLARLGGDEFLIVQMAVTQPTGAKAMADRLLSAFDRPYELFGMQVFCTSSIGVAIAPADATEWDRLLSCADAALYKSKELGRGSVSFFEKGLDANIDERRRIESELRRALDANLLRLTYQPIVTFPERTLVGFESILNWPEGWAPRRSEEFIPVAAECGLIIPIGSWLIKAACLSAAAWKEPLKVAVKLFPVQLRQSDIVATVEEALQSSGLAPERLELEISESIWVESGDRVVDQLLRLRHLGVSVVLDDLGGNSSILKYLWQFQFDEVKIDRLLARKMKVNPQAEAMVDALVAMGKACRFTITTEGEEVNTPEEILNSVEHRNVQNSVSSRQIYTR